MFEQSRPSPQSYTQNNKKSSTTLNVASTNTEFSVSTSIFNAIFGEKHTIEKEDQTYIQIQKNAYESIKNKCKNQLTNAMNCIKYDNKYGSSNKSEPCTHEINEFLECYKMHTP